MTAELDERDRVILDERTAALDKHPGIRVGDFVRFADGATRRVSYLWPHGAQTSDGGSYYLGHGYVSMSGSLYSPVKLDTLTLTRETRPGAVWFFHHDHFTAHNGVHANIPFRLYECSLPTQDKYCLRCKGFVWGGHAHGAEKRPA